MGSSILINKHRVRLQIARGLCKVRITRKRSLSFIFVLMLLCVVAGGCSTGDDNSAVEYNPTEGTQPITKDVSGSDYYTPEIGQSYPPSVYVTVLGVDVLLVDMDDPIVRSFFSGSEGLGGDIHEITLNVYCHFLSERHDVSGYIDVRYTFPIYRFKGEPFTEEKMQMAHALLEGARLLDFVEPADFGPGTGRLWGGLAFDEEGVYFSNITWSNDVLRPSHSDSDFRSSRDWHIRHIDGFFSSMEYGFYAAYVITNHTREELISRGFDLDNTTVIGGSFYSWRDLIFTDGENEIIRIGSNTRDDIWTTGDFVTAEEYAIEIIRLLSPDIIEGYYTPTEAAPDNQIIFGYDFFPDDISWETVITDPGDVALIESFLRDLQSLEIHAPPTGGIGHRLSLMLDGVPTRFLISQTTLGISPDRVDIVQIYPPAEFPANFMSADWRIWQVLLPYDQFEHTTDIRTIMPRHSLTFPQDGGIHSLGQIFEQSGVKIEDVRRISIRVTGPWWETIDITDAAELAEILELMTQVQLTLTSQDVNSQRPVFHVHIITDDFVVVIFLGAEALAGCSFSPSTQYAAAFYCEVGAHLHARLVTLFG